jgi:hypothetical protein
MSPSHTRRHYRIYRQYGTREAIAEGYNACPVTSVPAADVEGATLDVQKLLAVPGLGCPDLGNGDVEGDGTRPKSAPLAAAVVNNDWHQPPLGRALRCVSKPRSR